MKLTQKEVRGVTIVEIRGRLIDVYDSPDSFHDLIESLMADGAKRVVIDLQRTPWANSEGIGLLIEAFNSVTNSGGDLVLARVATRVHDVLAVTRLLHVFKTFNSIEGAIDYLLGKQEGGERTTRSDSKHGSMDRSHQNRLDQGTG